MTGGVLLTNFLLILGASPLEIGMLSSIPMLVNLLQPLGAYFADRNTSRRFYNLLIFVPARLIWLILVLGIAWISWSNQHSDQLVSWTLGIVLLTNVLAGLGTASWFSWMAALVPHRLRGRYFGFRNSAASLTTLISVPLLGNAISAWPNGIMQGYCVVLFLGIVAGLMSLGCQFFMADVNPQRPLLSAVSRSKLKEASDQDLEENAQPNRPQVSILNDSNFLKFLLYVGPWTFAVNLIAPFYNLYLLNNLALDLKWVTYYTSLNAAANLVMLVLWGRLADRLGNRPLLLLVGILVAMVPLSWLIPGTDPVSLWVWLPLVHLLKGGMWAAIDLCNNNIQMELAPVDHPSSYFAIAAAVSGIGGALGTTAGGILAQLPLFGGLTGLFVISAGMRLLALFPLIFVREPRSQPVVQVISHLLGIKQRSASVQAIGIADPPQ